MKRDSATTSCSPEMTRWLRNLGPRSRHRAERANFVHDLAVDHAQQLFRQQGGLCAISGLPFSLATFADVLVKHPFAPSLDRISSRGGYTAANIRLVCIAVNFGMGQWGEELYLTFARAAVEHSDQINAATRAPDAAMNPTGRLEIKDVEATSWFSVQRERIAAAEAIALTLSGKSLAGQRRRLASLKRNLTLGPAGLKAAAANAVKTRAR